MIINDFFPKMGHKLNKRYKVLYLTYKYIYSLFKKWHSTRSEISFAIPKDSGRPFSHTRSSYLAMSTKPTITKKSNYSFQLTYSSLWRNVCSTQAWSQQLITRKLKSSSPATISSTLLSSLPMQRCMHSWCSHLK